MIATVHSPTDAAGAQTRREGVALSVDAIVDADADAVKETFAGA
eukprot:SAG31_NODE_46102_length_256_cov_0.585987_1_plen_43_part_10